MKKRNEKFKDAKVSRRSFSAGAAVLGASLPLTLSMKAAAAPEVATDILRTPEDRFENLADYDFKPHYMEIPYGRKQKLRMHYIDEGDRNAPVILCLHGQATWAYLYRKVIPVLVDAGFRAVAPDYIGFGRSDKLASEEDYTFKGHIEWIKIFMREMEFDDVTALMFDWGGFFGLRVAGESPELFDRLVLANTQLPTLDEGESAWFNRFRAMVIGAEEFPIGKMVNDGVPGTLSAETIAGFDAPFPDQSYKAGPRSFPMIHPITEYDAPIEPNRAAWAALAEFDKPVLTVFSEMTAKTAMDPAMFHTHIPGAKDQPHVILPGGGFYVVEAKPVEVAQHIIDFVRSTSS